MPAIVPVIFGVITPIAFTLNGILTKHLTIPGGLEHKFEATSLAFSAYLIVNLIVLIVAIWFWSAYIFSSYLFWVGLVGSFINTLGMVCMTNAITKGPAGPASAIAGLSNIFLVIIEVIKYKRWLSTFEFLGFITGVFGALILVIP